MENQTIRMKALREKYLKNLLNNQFLGSQKDFVESKDRESKDREEKIKKRDRRTIL